MKCQECQQRLLEFVYGELPPRLEKEFTRALDDCPECQQELAQLQRFRSAFEQAMPQVDPPALVRANILREARKQLDAEAEASGEGLLDRLQALVFHPSFAMAAVVVLVISVTIVLQNDGAFHDEDLPSAVPSGGLQAPSPSPAKAALAPAEAMPEAKEEAARQDQGIVNQARTPADEDNMALPQDSPGAADVAANDDDDVPSQTRTGSPASPRRRNAPPASTRSASTDNKAPEPVVAKADKKTANQRTWDAPSAPAAQAEEPEPAPAVQEEVKKELERTAEAQARQEREVRSVQKREAATKRAKQDLVDRAQSSGNRADMPVQGWNNDSSLKGSDSLNESRSGSLGSTRDGRGSYSLDPRPAGDGKQNKLLQAESDKDTQQQLAKKSVGKDTGGVDTSLKGKSNDTRNAAPKEPSSDDLQGDYGKTPQLKTAELEDGADQGPGKEGKNAKYDQHFKDGMARYNTGDYRTAIREFDAFMNSAPRSSNYYARALYHRGRSEFGQARWRESASSFRKVIAEHPGSEVRTEARYWLARALLQINPESAEAAQILNELARGGGGYAEKARQEYDRAFSRKKNQARKSKSKAPKPASKKKSAPSYEFDAADEMRPMEQAPTKAE